MVTVNWCCWWGLLDWVDYIRGVGERLLSKFDPMPVLSSGDGAYLEVTCKYADNEPRVAFGHPYSPKFSSPAFKSIPFIESDISEITRNTNLNISRMNIFVRIPH